MKKENKKPDYRDVSYAVFVDGSGGEIYSNYVCAIDEVENAFRFGAKKVIIKTLTKSKKQGRV